MERLKKVAARIELATRRYIADTEVSDQSIADRQILYNEYVKNRPRMDFLEAEKAARLKVIMNILCDSDSAS